MEFQKFSLGLRFQVDGDARKTAVKAWPLLFSFLSPEDVSGMQLYGLFQPASGIAPEPSYICVFSRASLRRCKSLYARLSANPLIRSYLSLYRPYLQNNCLSLMEGYKLLGTVDDMGRVTGGEVARGEMRFTGRRPEKDPLAVEPPVFLLAPDTYCGVLPPVTVMRELMRIAYSYFPFAQIEPFPIPSGATGTIEALLYALGGRYVECTVEAASGERRKTRYGVLPDRTVVIEDNDAQTAQKILLSALDSGYTSFVVGVNAPEDGDAAGYFAAEADERLGAASIFVLSGEMRISAFLDQALFDKYVQQASIVITGDGNIDAQGDTVSEILRRCKARNMQAAVLEGAMVIPESKKDAMRELRKAANRLFRLLQMGNKLQHR